MSVNTTNRSDTFNMDGSTVDFDFTFTGLSSALTDIKAKTVLRTVGTETILTYTTGAPAAGEYSVDLNDNGVGGTVTVGSAASASYQLQIYRETTDTQATDYSDFGAFPADTTETALDKRTMKSQEQQEELNRTVKLPSTTSITDSTLPIASGGKLLGYNSAGTAFENKDATTGLPAGGSDSLAHYNGTAWGSIEIDGSTLENDATNGLQVKDDGITVDQIADNAVETAKIKDANVTADKLASNIGVAKAYVQFNGSSIIGDKLNTTSVSRQSIGNFVVRWTNAFDSSAYSFSISGDQPNHQVANINPTGMNVNIRDSSNNLTDPTTESIIAYGDLA